MPLKIHVATGQRVLINGAVVAPERQVRLAILNQASVVRLPEGLEGARLECELGGRLVEALFAAWLDTGEGARLGDDLDRLRRDAAQGGWPRAVDLLNQVARLVAEGADRQVILGLAETLARS